MSDEKPPAEKSVKTEKTAEKIEKQEDEGPLHNHGKIISQEIEEEMKKSYLDYAMSVIVSRALPDVRDGLKPVHRRVIYAMNSMGIRSNTAYKKSARIVGEVIGKYHPHGDAAVYNTAVRMAQDFSLRYMLVQGQGNFGCFTKDTEVQLADGRKLSFEKLVQEHKEGKKNYTYTCTDDKLIEIAEIKHPRMTIKQAELVKVALDNKEEIRCTPNHRFMLRNGEYREAQDLKKGDSLMPLYTRLSTPEDGYKQDLIGYELVKQPNDNVWVFTHHLADQHNIKAAKYTVSEGRVRHHVDFNKLNNNPENIQRMGWKDPEYQLRMRQNIIKGNKNHTTNNTGKKKFLKICNYSLEHVGTLNEQLYEEFRNTVYPYGHAPTWETGFFKYFENEGFEAVVNEATENHQVKSVTALQEKEDVYDLTIDGTHNFALAAGVFVHNSIDGDNPAAMRYTEARMTKLAEEMIADIDKDTVDFQENYDGEEKEPVVLPAKFPNLLVNGATGIAVGMATNMPPHNLGEVSKAVIELIDNKDAEIKDLLEHIKGPDFPTGGLVQGIMGFNSAYLTGRGKVRVKAVMHEEEHKKKKRLVITEIPYMVNKSMLIEQIANGVRDKRIEGISDLRDESDRNGMRIVIELKRDANPDIVQNQLYKFSRCQETFGIINLALVDGVPKVLNLKELLEHFLHHRQIVVRRRVQYELNKAKERAHILEGLVIALNHIDAVVELIKKAESVQVAQEKLMSTYELTEVQSKAILEMRLSRLAALEQEKIRNELAELKKKIAELEAILADEEKILSIIKEELQDIIEKYGDERRTEIVEGGDDQDIDLEDLIDEEDMVVTISTAGYIKRTGIDTYKAQRRGGKGIKAAATKEDDVLEHLFIANTHNFLLIFTNKGKVYWKKVYHVPEAGRYSKGTAIVNLVQMDKDEKVSAVIPVKEFSEGHYLLMATKKGTVKKTSLEAYSRPRQGGIKAINIMEGDDVVEVKMTDGKQTVLLATANGQAVKFDENDVRAMGRTSTGVRGVRLGADDAVIGMVLVDDETVLATITENGYGKKTRVSDYRLINRGGKGVRNIICSERNGKVVAIRTVTDEDDLMYISSNGIIIRTPAKDISVIGRNTQGVRLMKLGEGNKVVSATKLVREEEDGELVENEEIDE